MSPLRVLAVEDNPADRTALKIAIASLSSRVELSLAENADEAMQRLSRAPRPHLLLVDVNMPGRSGLDLLAEIKNSRQWRDIPVWMLSGSLDPRDVGAAYSGYASGFLKKPEDGAGLRRLTDTLVGLCAEWLLFPEALGKIR